MPENFDIKQYIWLIILVVSTLISSTDSNIQFALGEITADIVRDGLILTPIVWLTTYYLRKPWQWYDWLNMLLYTTAIANIIYPDVIDDAPSALFVVVATIFIITFSFNYWHKQHPEENNQANIKQTQERFDVQDFINRKKKSQQNPKTVQTSSAKEEDYIGKIKEAKSLLDKNIISEEQFEKIKQKIINNI